MGAAGVAAEARKLAPAVAEAFRRHGLINFAASIAFLTILALVPFLLFLLFLLALLGFLQLGVAAGVPAARRHRHAGRH